MRVFIHTQNHPQQRESPNRTRSSPVTPAARHQAHPSVHWQRMLGNHAVQRLWQAQLDDLDARFSSNEGTRSADDFSQRPGYPTSLASSQAPLTGSSPGDIYEQEADRVAAQVVRMPEPQLQCACGGGCQRCRTEQPGQGHEHLQIRRVGASALEQAARPPMVHAVLQSPGQPMDHATRAVMEQRFGYDFRRVRIHADAQAATSAQVLQAHAYTSGTDIVFGAGQYQPLSMRGQRLLAHELTHVVQQRGESLPRHLQRQPSPPSVPASVVIRDAPNAKTWTGAPATCGPNFCRPLPSEGMAIDDRQTFWLLFAPAIGWMVDSRVVPLWSRWAYGGSAVQDLTPDFGADFSASPTTAKTTQFLLDRIKAKLTASPPTIPPGAGFLKLDIPTLIPTDVKAIDDPSSPDAMNFNVINDIPGNIAGGIGKDQAATPIGATPSPQNDERIAKGEVTVIDAGANLLVFPHLSYTVKDTIDLCPGNCGSEREQKATIHMSQWEATGISGDVPYTVDFTAPPLPFTIPK